MKRLIIILFFIPLVVSAQWVVGDSAAFYGPISMPDTSKISKVATPTDDYDAANKKYVDDNSGGGSYSWTYKQGSASLSIEDGKYVEFKEGNGINLNDRTPEAGSVQLMISAANDDQWFDYKVVWMSGWTYYISSGYFYKNGEYYETNDTTITLNAAHATLDRIDVIALDTNETVVVITGTPASTPAKPLVDPISQLELTHIDVGAGETSPGITSETVYDENEEWTTDSSPAADVTVDFAYATSPYNGDSCVMVSHDTGGAVSGSSITFSDATTNTLNNKLLSFYLKTNATWLNSTQITIKLYDGTTMVGYTVMSKHTNMFRFDDTDTDWQQVAVDFTDFNITGTEFDSLFFGMYRCPADLDFAFDYIRVQDATATAPAGANLLTQDNSTRTSFPIPNNDAARITQAGFYDVVSVTDNMPYSAMDGTLIASRKSSGDLQFIFMSDMDSLYLSNDLGTTWTEVGGGSSSPWTKSGNHVYPETIGDSVGIGTVTPTAALEVDGQAKIDTVRFSNDARYFMYGSSYPIVKTTNAAADKQFIVENSSGIHVLEVNQDANKFFTKLYAWRSASGQLNLLTIDNTYATCGAMEFYNGKYGGNAIIFDGTPTWGGAYQKMSALANGDDGSTYGGSAIEAKKGTLYFHANNTVDLLTISSSGVDVDANLVVTGTATINEVLSTGQSYITDNDATPDVSGGNIQIYSGSANSVTITDLDNPVVGAIYTIVGNSDTYTISIADSGNFNLSAAWTGGADDVITILVLADNDYIEISRSDN